MRITDQGPGTRVSRMWITHLWTSVGKMVIKHAAQPRTTHWFGSDAASTASCQLPVASASLHLQLASSNRLEKCCNEAFTIANELITTASGINTCLDLIEEPMPNVCQPKSVDIYGISIYVSKGGYPGECNIGNRPHWSSNRSAIAFRLWLCLTSLLLFFSLFYLFLFFFLYTSLLFLLLFLFSCACACSNCPKRNNLISWCQCQVSPGENTGTGICICIVRGRNCQTKSHWEKYIIWH